MSSKYAYFFQYQAFMSTVVFKTPNDRATKELYKSVVEHHTFYRYVIVSGKQLG